MAHVPEMPRPKALGRSRKPPAPDAIRNPGPAGLLAPLPRTARSAALHALLLVDGGLTAQQALADVRHGLASEAGQSEPQTLLEQQLCSDLVYGYLRAEIRIAFILSRVLPRPRALPRPMLLMLGLAVYAMLFQEKVPDHAAVHSAVGAVRVLYGQNLARVANGALRSVQRLGQETGEPGFYARNASPAGQLEAASLYYSVPLWVARLWQSAYGPDAAQALLRRSWRRPWSALRINGLRPGASALHAALLALDGVRVGQWGTAFAPGRLPASILGKSLGQWESEGFLSFQSAGSQAALEALGLWAWQEPVWDVCAGFGGKTAALLERGVPLRLASDLSLGRLSGLPRQCRRLGLPCPGIFRADATRPPLARWPGHMLVDAPCSGLGVLARRPDIRRRSPQHLAELEARQGALLARLVALLPPGGRLAYVTCTLNPVENERLVENILISQGVLRLEAQWQTDHGHAWLEGMYGAVLRRA